MSIRSDVDKLKQSEVGPLGFDLAAALSIVAVRPADAAPRTWGPQDPNSVLERRLVAAQERLVRMRAEDEARPA